MTAAPIEFLNKCLQIKIIIVGSGVPENGYERGRKKVAKPKHKIATNEI